MRARIWLVPDLRVILATVPIDFPMGLAARLRVRGDSTTRARCVRARSRRARREDAARERSLEGAGFVHDATARGNAARARRERPKTRRQWCGRDFVELCAAKSRLQDAASVSGGDALAGGAQSYKILRTNDVRN